MITLPKCFLHGLVFFGIVREPDFVCQQVSEVPDEISPGTVFYEVRGGFSKWAHLQCPRCAERIQLQLRGSPRWKVSNDLLGRPTIEPSIWQTGSCNAHFFVRSGAIVWCKD